MVKREEKQRGGVGGKKPVGFSIDPRAKSRGQQWKFSYTFFPSCDSGFFSLVIQAIRCKLEMILIMDLVELMLCKLTLNYYTLKKNSKLSIHCEKKLKTTYGWWFSRTSFTSNTLCNFFFFFLYIFLFFIFVCSIFRPL